MVVGTVVEVQADRLRRLETWLSRLGEGDGPRFALGGFEIVDLRTDQAVYQVPVELWTESGLPMTFNPFWIETAAE